MTSTPQDQAARDSAEHSLDQTTFIAAGAGTGKTSTIVKRIVNTVCDPKSGFPIRNLAAITFTERAAAELRRRIRLALSEKSNAGSSLAASALLEFDAAQIGTIHAFAKRILSNFPIEAGLPITFEILDQPSSNLSIRDTASRYVQRYFEQLDWLEKSVLAEAEVTPIVLRNFFIELNSKRLLVNEEDVISERQLDSDTLVEEFRNNLFSWFESERNVWQGFSTSLSSKIESGLEALARIFAESNTQNKKEVRRLQAALHTLMHPGNSGGDASKPFKEEMRKRFKGGLDGLEYVSAENLIRRDLPMMWANVKDSVAQRVKRGRLTFDDLIVLATELIEANPDVRAKLQRDFRLIVVDEFQDTDPLQWKLVSLITTPRGQESPSEGSLVLVGDAQQSIYSFRGADVATYLNVADKVGDSQIPGIKKTLEVNFRSNQLILNWVNSTFGHNSVDLGTEFAQLLPADRNQVSDTHLPGVSVIGGPDVTIDYRSEPSYVASAAHQAVAQAWPVLDSRDNEGVASFRAANYSDVVILLPARTSLEDLLDQLSAREIPYRSSDSAIVFDRPIVRGLIDALRVIAGVEQPLDLWFALKSPLFGCDDLELLAYKQLGGRWTLPYGEASPELEATRVHKCLSKLAKIRRTSNSGTPAAIMSQLIEECRVMTTYDQTPRGRFEFECVQMVTRQARSWSHSGGAGLADYLAWIKDQLSENARESLPESDDLGDDAVRISTVHGVKGLEFPIVILGGMARNRIPQLPTISLKRNALEFNFGDFKSIGYRRDSERLEIAGRLTEQARILYVAATRAKDHLVVSNLAKVSKDGSTSSWSGLYREAVAESVELGLARRFDHMVPWVSQPSLTIKPSFSPEAADWLTKLPEIRAKSKVKNLVTPSSGGSRFDPDTSSVSLELVDDTQQSSLNYQDEDIAGADVAKLGNAFHLVMERAIERRLRETDDSLALDMKRSLAEYGVPEQEERLARMVARILQHEVMDRIYSADKVLPELAISEINQDGVLVEGFADLVIQESDSLVVLDYKTNLELSKDKVAVYAAQLDAYAQIIQRATPYKVTEKIIVHVLPEKVELIAV